MAQLPETSIDDRGVAAELARRQFQEWIGQAHARPQFNRTAARHAAFFLPYLKPGMRVLDAGCGGGSITVGLAGAVAPGVVTGLDIRPGAVAAATAYAASLGIENVRFEYGDVFALPFTDGSFDAIFVHALLQHLGDPVQALRRLLRVLKPGGVIGLADADYNGSVYAPATRDVRRAMRLMLDARRASGGDMRVGGSLRLYLHRAGFERATATASTACEGTPEATAATGEFWARYCEAPEFVGIVTASGIADAAGARAAAAAWRKWGAHPGAYWARFWCEAIAYRPT